MRDENTTRPRVSVTVMGATGFPVVSALFAQCFDDPWPEPSVRELMASPGARALIATDTLTEAPIGFLLARVVVDEAEILSVGVVPACRREGIGVALFTAFHELAEAAGARSVFLEVGRDNPNALALYSALGFERVGTRRDYYTRADQTRVDAILMRFSIGSNS